MPPRWPACRSALVAERRGRHRPLSQKILKATVADLGEKAVDPKHLALINRMVDDLDRRGRKNSKGFYDYPAKPAKKSLWPELKTFYPQKKAMTGRRRRPEAAIPRHHRAGSRPHRRGRHRHRPPRSRRRLHPRLRLRALYRRRPESYIDGMGAKTFVALGEKLAASYGAALQADGAVEGHGGQGRDVLRSV
jgi:3-hydroxyacyl-CoA dehydrogenase/enoyl-CoA hydratase/3-hydroxybutyryl-CoA epimerase